MHIKKNFKTPERILELARNLWVMQKKVERSERNIDLNEAEFVTPLSILPLAAYASENDLIVNLRLKNKLVRNFLNAIYFPQGCTTNMLTRGSIPICKIDTAVESSSLNIFEDNLLSLTNNPSLLTPLKYLTSELVTNVKEHAKIDKYWIYAQYYRKTNNCEVCIVDTGIGIKTSYDGTEYEVATHKEAIIQAIQGKSSKETERGHGLPSIINIFTKGLRGELLIMSGNSALYINQRTRGVMYRLPSDWKGTVAFLKFPINRGVNIYEYLEN